MVNKYERSVRLTHTRNHYGDTYIFMRAGIDKPTNESSFQRFPIRAEVVFYRG
jgi:hypothetical protein